MKKVGILLLTLVFIIGVTVFVGCEEDEIEEPENEVENQAGNEAENENEARVGLTYWTEGELLDGDYRGAYVDDHRNAVVVQFTVEDGTVVETGFRDITYDDVIYDTEDPEIPEDSPWMDYAGEDGIKELTEQYISAFEYLEGAESFEEIKEITKEMEGNPGEDTELYEFIEPKEVEGEEIDTFSAATIRSDKIGSAVRDAINRGTYR
ncbi:FMN-binding protein [Natranaerobius thermophilus]|uniref:FMN-binding protein n=1 Tax=Natranaerobius thermophilus TaxID=375929 RepID=UPI0001666C9E|nr:FMN-binding protein [Natranaerobius thermophilus]